MMREKGLMILIIVCVWTYIIISLITTTPSLSLSSGRQMTSFGKAKASQNEIVVPPWLTRERIPVPQIGEIEKNTLEPEEKIEVEDLVEDTGCVIERADDDFIKTRVALRSCDAVPKRNGEDTIPTDEWIHPSTYSTMKTNILIR